jgi:uroporphyrinogen decarboxylase
VIDQPISESAPGARDGVYRDDWGITWKALAGHPYIPMEQDAVFDADSSISDLQAHPWPDPTHPKYTDGLAEAARRLRQSGDHAIVMGMSGRVFTLGQFMCGFEEWSVRLLQDPTFAAHLMDRGLDIQMEIIARQLEAAGENVDVVCIVEDLGMQSGPLFSPRLYRKLIRPRHEKLFRFIRERTAAKLMLHSDGSIIEFLPDLIDAGVEALNPVQVSAGGMDAGHLKREFGAHLSFWGAIDTQYVLPRGSVQDVRDEVKRRIGELGAGGGYVLTSVHNIQPEVSPENIRAMCEATREFGQYPLFQN